MRGLRPPHFFCAGFFGEMMKRVAIIGGGVAGLAAAYELARLARDGADVQGVLFEASTRLGGIVETVREGGFVIECGPDAWVTEKPWARELAEELGLGDEVMPSNDAATEDLCADRQEAAGDAGWNADDGAGRSRRAGWVGVVQCRGEAGVSR